MPCDVLRVPSSLHIGLVSIILSILTQMKLSYIHLMFSNLNLVVSPPKYLGV